MKVKKAGKRVFGAVMSAKTRRATQIRQPTRP